MVGLKLSILVSLLCKVRSYYIFIQNMSKILYYIERLYGFHTMYTDLITRGKYDIAFNKFENRLVNVIKRLGKIVWGKSEYID